jgi:uncharacterized lipoprotein YddW (UPF0748 family)
MFGDSSRADRATFSRRRVIRGGAAAVGAAALTSQVGAVGEELGQTADSTSSTGDPEVRAIYTTPKWYWDGDRIQRNRLRMQQFLDRAEEAGLNALYAWIESDGLASLLGEPTYAESPRYDFWNPDRGWDPLGELVAGAAKRGIEVHLWYSFVRYKRSTLPVPEYNPDLEVLPPGDPSWAALSKAEYEAGHEDSTSVDSEALCANEPGARAWALEALDRAFEQYPMLSGLHIEEPGWLDAQRCVCPRCRELYAEIHDDAPENYVEHVYDTAEPYAEDDLAIPVKNHGTDAFVEALYDWWQSRSGSDTLSYNGSWLPEFDHVRGRNWPTWSDEGWVPYFAPQIYTRDLDVYRKRLEATMDALSETVVVPVTGMQWGTKASERNDPGAVADEIELVRSMDGYADVATGGTGLFSGSALSPEMTVGLRADPYTQSATPHWSQGETEQSRGDATLAEMRTREPVTFEPRWETTVPGTEASVDD